MWDVSSPNDDDDVCSLLPTLPSSAISHQLVGTYLHISAQIDNGAGIISS